MSRVGETMPTDYSDRFDELRQNRGEHINKEETSPSCFVPMSESK